MVSEKAVIEPFITSFKSFDLGVFDKTLDYFNWWGFLLKKDLDKNAFITNSIGFCTAHDN